MIHISNLHVVFQDEMVFDRFSLGIAAGEQVAVWGKSGIGKSTLLHILLGFVSDFRGEVAIHGMDLNPDNIQLIRKHTVWLPQEITFDFQSVEEMFYAPFTLEANQHARPTQEEVHSLFEVFEVNEGWLKKSVQEISGGQKQRILLASCLLTKKPLLLLDEPTSALDERLKKKITDYILNLKDTTILAVTHDEYWIEKSNRNIHLTNKPTP